MARAIEKDRMSWFKHDPAKFNLDTSGLSNQAVGIYIKLINLYWINERKMPPHKETWVRQIGVASESEHSDLEQLLTELDIRTDDGYYIPDLDRQLNQIRGYSAEQSERASNRHKKEREEKIKPEGECTPDIEDF
jgi:uncharacterized protein YdaU (DUF1376 family)